MQLECVEMLMTQKKLLELPRNKQRFDAYLETMTGGTDDILLPIGLFNPMSKDHVAEKISTLLSLDAEGILKSHVDQFNSRLDNFNEIYRVAIVVADDEVGGWTCRETIELNRVTTLTDELKRKWLTVLWWCSDDCNEKAIHREVAIQIHKSVEVLLKGPVNTLRALVELEKKALNFAGQVPNPQKLEWMPRFRSLEFADDVPTIISAFYGDATAEKLGYTKLGFPDHAGRSVALARD